MINSITTNKSQRSVYWDVVKGVLILLVIIGHAIQWSNGDNVDFLQDPVFKFIYGFHMPLFALVSGYFFFFSVRRHSAKEIIVNRIRQCVLPIITVTLLVELTRLNLSPHSILVHFFSNLWFLWVVFFLSCFVILIKYALKDNVLVYVLCFFLTFIMPSFLMSTSIFFLYPFFIAGYFFNRYGVFESVFGNSRKLLLCTIVFGLMYVVALFFFDNETYIYSNPYNVLHGNGWHIAFVNIQRVITGFCGSFFLVGIIRLTYLYYHATIQNVLVFLGVNTLQLYIISTLPYFRTMEVYYSNGQVNYLLAVVSAVLLTGISLLIIEVLKRFQITNFLFFGHKLNLKKSK